MKPLFEKNFDRFDLEEAIQSAWHLTDDLGLIYEAYDELSEDEFLNALIGIRSVAELRFQKLWQIFEEVVHNNRLNAREWGQAEINNSSSHPKPQNSPIADIPIKEEEWDHSLSLESDVEEWYNKIYMDDFGNQKE